MDERTRNEEGSIIYEASIVSKARHSRPSFIKCNYFVVQVSHLICPEMLVARARRTSIKRGSDDRKVELQVPDGSSVWTI